VLKLASEMIWRKIQEEALEMEKVNTLVDSLNSKYKSKIMLSSVLDALEERGAIIQADKVFIKGKEKKEIEEEIETEEEKYEKEVEEGIKEQEEMKEKGITETGIDETGKPLKELSLAIKIDEENIRKIANKNRKKRTLGLFGSEERIKGMILNFEPIYKVSVNDFDLKKEFVSVECYVNSLTGELLHFDGKKFIESKGFTKAYSLTKDESLILRNLLQKKTIKEVIEKNPEISEGKAKKIVSSLADKGFLKKEKKEGKVQYSLNQEMDLPSSLKMKLISSVNNCSFTENLINNIVKEEFSAEQVNLMIKGLWANSVVKKTEKIFRPVYYITFEENGKERILKIDAMTGQIIK